MSNAQDLLPTGYDGLLDWLSARQIPDRLFAKAYDFVGDRHRAWIKSTLAANFAESERALPPVSITKELPGGLELNLRRKNPHFAWLFAQAGSLSGVRFAAAVGVLAACGVGEIGLVCLGSARQISASVLAAAELGGVERVCCLSPKKAIKVVELLAESGDKGFFGLFQHKGSALWPGLSALTQGHVLWRCNAPGTIGLFAEDESRQAELAPLAEELGALHPDCSVRFFDPMAQLADLDREVSGPASLFTQGLDALVVDDARRVLDATLGPVPLLLTPDTLGLWRHQDLHPSLVYGPLQAIFSQSGSV